MPPADDYTPASQWLLVENQRLYSSVSREPLQVVAQNSFGLEILAAVADVRALPTVVQLVDAEQRAGEEELPTGQTVVVLFPGVSGPLVAEQGTRGDEALAAVLAGERSLAGVDPLVGPPGVVVGEGLVTVGALVEFLLGVAEPVHLQVVGDREALPAVVTGERLLAHVEQSDVGLEVRRLCEPLATGGAEEGPLSGVGHHVGLQVGGLGEPLPTLGTLVRLQAGVGAVVQFQTLEAGEVLATFGAVVGLQVLVHPHVAVESALQLEAFPTGVTFVRLPVGVRGLVKLQTLWVAEGLQALGTGQQLPALVCLAVEVEALIGDKHLVAHFAVVALFTFVQVQVLMELPLQVEAITTEPALEGFGPRVGPVVGLPVSLQSKGLVAVGALVGVVSVVDLLVDDQAHYTGVDLPTLPALIGFESIMAPLVSLQVGLLVETFSTQGAVEHLSACVGQTLRCPSLTVICWRSKVR